MTWPSLIQYGLFLLVVTLLVKPTGGYLNRVFAGERTLLDPILKPTERAIFRICGIDPTQEMDWKRYAGAFVRFGAFCTVVL